MRWITPSLEESAASQSSPAPLSLQCTTSTACMCVYGLLSFVLTSLELHTLGNQQVSVWLS